MMTAESVAVDTVTSLRGRPTARDPRYDCGSIQCLTGSSVFNIAHPRDFALGAGWPQ
jgi:hypothetical protein